jgi:CheY-like chemotaxis protein
VGDAAPTRAEPQAKPIIKSPRLRVLVIDDHADSREMLQAMLGSDGHQTESAEDGPGGVEKARLAQPDVALIDIGLPGFDGDEVARRIRRAMGTSIGLIAVTGYGRAGDRRRSQEAGFDAHLVNPVTREQVRDALAMRQASAA